MKYKTPIKYTYKKVKELQRVQIHFSQLVKIAQIAMQQKNHQRKSWPMLLKLAVSMNHKSQHALNQQQQKQHSNRDRLCRFRSDSSLLKCSPITIHTARRVVMIITTTLFKGTQMVHVIKTLSQ